MTGTAEAPAVPLPEPLDDSQTGTPDRRPGSVRRTSSIDMTWPDGVEAGLHLVGRARDLLTTAAGEAVVLDEAEMRAVVDDMRTIRAIESTPHRPGIEGLVGAQGGTYLRGAIDEHLPGEREAATPLHLVLDDVAGTSLIAGFVWTRITPPEELRARMQARGMELGIRKGRIICSGLRPGGSAHLAREGGPPVPSGNRRAGSIDNPDDPIAWHEFPPRPEISMRRHRRIDLYPDGSELVVDSFFRDSFWEPDGTEMALHEYTVTARVDAASRTLNAVEATPRVLPFPECQWAPPHAGLLVGLPVASFRTEVQGTLAELQACTHLNDMLRCLAEVPALAGALDAAGA